MKNDKAGNIVIIGGSVSAVSAIESIRQRNKSVPLTVVTAENDVCYSRPLISHIGLKKEQFYYRDRKFFVANKVALVCDTAVSTDGKSVALQSGKKIGYSKLIIAAGGVPVIPKIEGIKGKNVFTFTTYSDALRIKESAKGMKNAVVIGAGMIGIKAAEYLTELGLSVAMVELAGRPFASVLDDKSGKIIANEIKKRIKLILNSSVVKITPGACLLKGGKKIKCDIVVCAVGVVPNVAVAAASGIKTNRGIAVDSHMATSMKNVFAAGDCVEALDILTGENRPLPIWPVAHRQGRVAGLNAIGICENYDGAFVMNSVDIFGLPMITLGLSTAAGDESVVSCDESNSRYKKIILKGGRIIGAILVGDINRAGIFTGLIKDGYDVTNFKNDLLNDNFGYIYVPKENMSSEVVPTEI